MLTIFDLLLLNWVACLQNISFYFFSNIELNAENTEKKHQVLHHFPKVTPLFLGILRETVKRCFFCKFFSLRGNASSYRLLDTIPPKSGITRSNGKRIISWHLFVVVSTIFFPLIFQKKANFRKSYSAALFRNLFAILLGYLLVE